MPEIWPDLTAFDDTYLSSGDQRPSLALPALRAGFNAVKAVSSLRNQPGGIAGLNESGQIDPALVGGTPQPENALLTALSNLTLTTAERLLLFKLTAGNPEIVSVLTGAVAASLLQCADVADVRALLGVEPGEDVQAYGARLDALRALLDTLATAGPVDPETGSPTPQQCLLRYGASGNVEADTTPYLKSSDLNDLVTSTTLAGEISALSSAVAAEYLTTAQGDDRYIEQANETSILSHIYGTDFTADVGAQPFFTAALSSGTITGSSGVDAEAGHHGIVKLVTAASATANSGYRLWTGRYAIWMSGGQWFQVRFKLPSVTDVSHRIGFFDQNTITAVTNGIYLDIVNSTATAYTTAASTSSSSAYGTALAINTWYRADVQFVAGGDLAVIRIYNDDTGSMLFQAALSTNLPLNAKCAAGVIFTATTAVSSKDLVLIDSMHYKARA